MTLQPNQIVGNYRIVRPLGVLYYVMDLVEGVGDKRTLADVKPGEADEGTVFCWFQQLCDALAFGASELSCRES